MYKRIRMSLGERKRMREAKIETSKHRCLCGRTRLSIVIFFKKKKRWEKRWRRPIFFVNVGGMCVAFEFKNERMLFFGSFPFVPSFTYPRHFPFSIYLGLTKLEH